MSRAYGWNAKLLITEEKEYGVMPDEGYIQIPFISSTVDSEQNLIASNILGFGRDPTQPFQDIIDVGYQVWEVLLKLPKPDLSLALDIARNLNFDMELMSELLPIGIAGMIKVINDCNKE